MYKDYTRLGGWLMLYVVTRIFSSVINVTTVISVFAQGRVVDGILIVFPVAMAITVVVRIFRRDDTARYWLLGEGICYLLSAVYQFFIVMSANATSVVVVAFSVITYAAWYLYFVKSKRVAVYMHPEQYLRMPPPPYGQPQMYGAPLLQVPPMPQAPSMAPAPRAADDTENEAGPAAGTVPTDATAQVPQAQAVWRVCTRCGKQAPPEARFCGGCGNPLL